VNRSFILTKITLVIMLLVLLGILVATVVSSSLKNPESGMGFLLPAAAHAASDTPPPALHSRGDFAVEQIRRSEKSVHEEIRGPAHDFTASEEQLLRELHLARNTSDNSRVLEIEASLKELRNLPQTENAPTLPSEERPEVKIINSQPHSSPGKWLPHEYLLTGDEFPEYHPDLACDTSGVLWSAHIREVASDYFNFIVQKSVDGGEHWSTALEVTNVAKDLPSIVCSEGNENWVFITFVNRTHKTVYVIRFDPANPTNWDYTTILTYPDNSICNPRLATDTAEYLHWYTYLVFNTFGPDAWGLSTTRTIDYGENWEDVSFQYGFCNLYHTVWDNHPDIDFGHGTLMIAFHTPEYPCNDMSLLDVKLISSANYGATFSEPVTLAPWSDKEFNPAISVAKRTADGPYAVVSYTRYYSGLDNDIWFASTSDNITWSSNHCLACTTEEEENVNLAVSRSEGYFHAAFYDKSNVDYARAAFDAALTWTRSDSLSTQSTLSPWEIKPAICADPTRPAESEAAIAWTDTRNMASTAEDIYFDAAVLPSPPDDYFLYTTFNPGVGAVCGVDGFIDTAGELEGLPGAQYLVFTGGGVYEGDLTAYVYRVDTSGDPNQHPDNPENTGPIAPRTFTLVNSHYLGYYASAHDNAFYVDETGFYYGASNSPRGDAPGWSDFMDCAVVHWDLQWNLLPCVVPSAAPGGAQTLARNPCTGDWWAGTAARAMYRWQDDAWVHQFTSPDMSGIHHDGLTVINNSLFVSDMTSDILQQYRLDDTGAAMNPPGSPSHTYYYTAAPSVEGMGFGPNGHIWFTGGGGGLCEIGGGSLQVALTGIPNQCIQPGDGFDTFDLDDFASGSAPFSWTWSGNTVLSISIDGNNVVTVSCPYGWVGQESVIFRMTDNLGYEASDQAIFTVTEAPVVGDIPNQSVPFEAFDLDDYLLAGDPGLITWSASGMDCMEVTIDPVTHVAEVSSPAGCLGPEEITFRASVNTCSSLMYDLDSAIFDMGLTPTADPVLGLTLGHASPNPCTSSTTVSYSLPADKSGGSASLAVFDVAGRRVRNLQADSKSAAFNTVRWDGRNERGALAPAGVYFIQLSWRNKTQSTRVVLIR